MRRAMLGLAAVIGLVSAPAGAGTLEARFGVQLFGLPVGQVVVATNEVHNAYAARGEFRTTGIVGFLAKIQFSMHARGSGQVPQLSSQSYSEDMATGYRESAAAVSFPPGDQRIDPLSAMIATMIDRPRAKGCAIDRTTYDGTRVMHVEVHQVAEASDKLTCEGVLTRISGYDAATMSRGRKFGFHIEYQIKDGWLKMARGSVETEHGNVALVRWN